RVQPLTVSVPLLKMPPPQLLATPSLIVRPLRVTFAGWATSNTREMGLPLTVKLPAPGPAVVRLCLRERPPPGRWMVWRAGLGAKTMVSKFLAAAISARSEPAPLSRLLVTVSVLGTQRFSNASSTGRKVGRAVGVFLRDGGRSDRPRYLDSQ